MLECLINLTPGGDLLVGRAALVRLLLGQPTALGTRSSNPYKGVLAGKLKSREIEKLLAQLVQAGLMIEENTQTLLGGTYPALRLEQPAYDWLAQNKKSEG